MNSLKRPMAGPGKEIGKSQTVKLKKTLQAPTKLVAYSSASALASTFITGRFTEIPRRQGKTDMEDAITKGGGGSSNTTLYPLHRTKILHLVRHAQGIHNVEGEKDPSAYFSPSLLDAHLTPLGWRQVAHLRTHIHQSGLHSRIQLVVTSSLLRAMQTAVGVFGGEESVDGDENGRHHHHHRLPLMVANAGNSASPAVSSLDCPPFLATELCREHLSLHPCDWRRSITETRPLFPAVDFSLIKSDEETLPKPGQRETFEEVSTRALKFLNWIWTRKEKEIAVVSHGGFLHDMLSLFGNDCHPTVKSEIGTRFANCQLRSIVLVDRGMIGSDPATTNYPLKSS